VYRPKSISEFIGLDKPKRILSKFAEQPYPSAWLLVGPSDIGKTSMAQALCAQMRGELHHIPSQKCTVDAIEKACHDCHFYVVLCDEADRMTPAAQLALLSKLDATAFPPNTVFIFTCNSPEGLEPRFLSRCRVIEFSSYGMAGEIAGYLNTVWHAEGGNGNGPDLARAVVPFYVVWVNKTSGLRQWEPILPAINFNPAVLSEAKADPRPAPVINCKNWQSPTVCASQTIDSDNDK
jgi:DNA polymerase III gamma/tau subunit